MKLCPQPEFTTSKIIAGSAPDLAPTSIASAAATEWMPTSNWFISLATVPVPMGPM